MAQENPGASIQGQRTLRDSVGKKLIDPKTSSGRRVDFAVIKKGKVKELVEVTSRTASKVQQALKEERIRELGRVFIRDKKTRLLCDVTDIATSLKRVK